MSNKVKLIIGIVLIILMIPVTGVVVVKDNMRNSSYCAGCHEDHYVSYTEPEEGYSLSHFHGEMGVSCQSCHQRTLGESVMEVVNYVTGNYYYPFPESTLSMDNCFACHESYENVIALTSTSLTHAERNRMTGISANWNATSATIHTVIRKCIVTSVMPPILRKLSPVGFQINFFILLSKFTVCIFSQSHSKFEWL